MSDNVYFDYAASTPVDERVLTAMLPYFTANFGNPSSVHSFGQRAEHALESARETVATQLNCRPSEVIFTSCGSESDNLALRGAALAARKARRASHLLVSPVEHHAVAHTAAQLQDEFDFELEYLPVDRFGRVSPANLATRIRPDTALASIIFANNEIGTRNDIAALSAVCRARGVPLHTDAVQAGAYIDLDVQASGIDLMAIGAHKFYGPKGIGVLYVRTGTPLLPTQTGGGHENGRRAGTSNIPYIVGLATALEIAQAEREQLNNHVRPLRDHLIASVLETIPEVQLTGHPSERLPNHASFVFNQIDGNELLTRLDIAGFACSSGSACKTGLPEPSDVLAALGLERSWSLGSLRVTLGKSSTPANITRFIDTLAAQISQMRAR